MFIVAHPDDEAIGCGGTIFKHKKNKDEVHLLYMTDGIASRDDSRKAKKQRNSGFQKAIELIEPHSFECLELPDNQLDTLPLLEIVKKIENHINDIKPEIIYTHSENDLNIDHQLVSKSVMTATRPSCCNYVKEIYSFYINSSSEWSFNEKCFNTNHFTVSSGAVSIKTLNQSTSGNAATATSLKTLPNNSITFP